MEVTQQVFDELHMLVWISLSVVFSQLRGLLQRLRYYMWDLHFHPTFVGLIGNVGLTLEPNILHHKCESLHPITGSNTGSSFCSPTKLNQDSDTTIGESGRVGSTNETNASGPQERETPHLNPKF